MTSRLITRRRLMQGAAGGAALAGIGMPAIVKAQADAIRIGHLTPITGFLGPLGEYAQMGVKLAAEEINSSGGVMGRKIELVMEDSVNAVVAHGGGWLPMVFHQVCYPGADDYSTCMNGYRSPIRVTKSASWAG